MECARVNPPPLPTDVCTCMCVLISACGIGDDGVADVCEYLKHPHPQAIIEILLLDGTCGHDDGGGGG